MTPKKIQAGFRLLPEVLDKMELIKVRDGVPYSEQVHRALMLYFAEKGVLEPHKPAKARRKHVVRG